MPRKQSPNLDHNLALGILVDPQDLDLLEQYRFNKSGGYARTKINGKTVRLHRLVHSRMTGKPLSEYVYTDTVRHVDPNGLDCRRSNIFEKTGNTPNHCDLNRALQSTNRSGVNGVCWYGQTEQWVVQLKYLGKVIYLGLYDTLEQATRVACHCRIVRAEITCSVIPLPYETMKSILQAEAKTI